VPATSDSETERDRDRERERKIEGQWQLNTGVEREDEMKIQQHGNLSNVSDAE